MLRLSTLELVVSADVPYHLCAYKLGKTVNEQGPKAPPVLGNIARSESPSPTAQASTLFHSRTPGGRASGSGLWRMLLAVPQHSFTWRLIVNWEKKLLLNMAHSTPDPLRQVRLHAAATVRAPVALLRPAEWQRSAWSFAQARQEQTCDNVLAER